MDAHAVKRNEETGFLESIDGFQHIDLFLTNKGNVLDRWEADEFFGITCSEDMAEQKLVSK